MHFEKLHFQVRNRLKYGMAIKAASNQTISRQTKTFRCAIGKCAFDFRNIFYTRKMVNEVKMQSSNKVLLWSDENLELFNELFLCLPLNTFDLLP